MMFPNICRSQIITGRAAERRTQKVGPGERETPFQGLVELTLTLALFHRSYLAFPRTVLNRTLPRSAFPRASMESDITCQPFGSFTLSSCLGSSSGGGAHSNSRRLSISKHGECFFLQSGISGYCVCGEFVRTVQLIGTTAVSSS